MEDIPWDAAAEAKQAVGEQERTAWKHQTVEEYLAHIDIELHVVILCPHAQSCANVLLEPFTRWYTDLINTYELHTVYEWGWLLSYP